MRYSALLDSIGSARIRLGLGLLIYGLIYNVVTGFS